MQSIKVRDVYEIINRLSPFTDGDSFDNVGLLVGGMDCAVSKILLALDVTNDVIDEAIKKGANLIVTHHPVIFNPLKRLVYGTPAYRLAENRINAIAAHTNFDVADHSTSDLMAELLGFETSGILNLEFPEKNKGYGRICNLEIAFSPKSLAEHAKKAFDCKSLRFCAGKEEITRVALCSGSAAVEMENAIKAGCQALITGDVKHDRWIDAINKGFTLIDAGHFPTENPFCDYMAEMLSKAFHEADISVAKASAEPFTAL